MIVLRTFLLLLLIAALLLRLDHYFFKKNRGFSLRGIQTNHLEQASSSEQIDQELFKQPYRYLHKGHQSFAFLSLDGNTILKLCRVPSHKQHYAWLKHPFPTDKRKTIYAYDEKKWHETFASYGIAYAALKEESGLIAIHLGKTSHLKQQVVLIDAQEHHHLVDLDNFSFLLQQKADPFFPTLEKSIGDGDLAKTKRMLDSFVNMIEKRAELGIIDKDPILEKNYGWIGEKAIMIDVGRLSKNSVDPSIEKQKKTAPLRSWLKSHSTELYIHLTTQVGLVP